jgi:3'-5' exoribonuclease
MSNQAMKNIPVGQEFTGLCIIRKKELKHKKNGEPYLKLELGDSSGRMPAKIWREAEDLFNHLKVGQMISVKGKIRSYRNTREVRVEQLSTADQRIGKDYQTLLPTSRSDIQRLHDRLELHVKSIKNEYLLKLISVIFPDKESWDHYLKMPSGKLWHHNYLYGNLEHLVCLLDMADTLYHHYPRISADLLKTGIMLHNLGNTIEYTREGFIDYSTTGRLLGHSFLALSQVRNALRRIPRFPEELKLQLLHIIGSQENGPEKSGNTIPMTFEAIALGLLKQVDIRMNAAERVMTYDRMEGSPWTTYNRIFQRFLYTGEAGTEESTKNSLISEIENKTDS